LQYVKGAVQRQSRGHMPRGIAIVWAVFVLVGFAGLDLQPQWAGIFLLAGGPVAYLISNRIGYGAARSAGISDRTEMRRHMLHWGSLFLAILALLPLAIQGRLGGETFGQMILILVGLVHFLAGVHFQIRLFLWLGPLMMVGAVALSYIDHWGWTTLGVLIAAGILASGFVGRRDG
jgi:hypothetical protein